MAADREELRLFCICGQKMKVSGDMWGQPGRCVACRQRIRIPRRDEVAEGVEDVYLKNHPEFLRKAQKADAPSAKKKKAADPSKPAKKKREVALGDDELSQGPPSIPMHVLEPLRLLVSLDEKITRTLKRMKKEGGTAVDRAEWEGYQARLEIARNDLDDQLRQRLMEAAIALTNAEERIGEVGLAVRMGEMEFREFRDTIAKLRHRRDRLERRQRNLRGWLATRHSAIAGGYLEASPAAIPGAGASMTFPADMSEPGPPLQVYLEELRRAMEVKDRAARKIAEGKKLAADGNLPKSSLDSIRAEEKGVAARADSAIEFFRGRLSQLMADFEHDVKAANAQVELARSRLKVGEIDRAQYERIERDLVRVRNDMAKARALTRRALSAGSARDVPAAAGTFLERMAKTHDGERLTPDVGLACAAALLFLVTIVLPSIAGHSPIAAFRQQPDDGQHWVISGPVVLAISAILSAAVPLRLVRGALLTALCSVATIISVYLLHRQDTASTQMAEMFRASNVISLGSVTYWVAMTLLAVGAGVALWRNNRQRALFAGLLAPAIIVAPLILSNLGGALRAEPVVAVGSATLNTEGYYDLTIDVRNAGAGSFVFALEPNTNAQADFILERQAGPNSWMPIDPPARIAVGGVSKAYARGTGGAIAVSGDTAASLEYSLAEGSYRLTLRGPAVAPPLVQPFNVAPPAVVAPTEQDVAPEAEAEDAEVMSEDDVATTPERVGSGVMAEMRGQMLAGDYPQFKIDLTFRNGEVRSRMLELRDELYGGWVLEEYNRDSRALVISRDDAILVLRPGEPIEL